MICIDEGAVKYGMRPPLLFSDEDDDLLFKLYSIIYIGVYGDNCINVDMFPVMNVMGLSSW